MSKKEIETLKALLRQAEQAITCQLKEYYPFDSAPDKETVAIIKRLELAESKSAETFRNIRLLIESYLE